MSTQFLICPNCGGEIRISRKDFSCKKCKKTYPVKKDIPLLFDDQQMLLYRESVGTPQEYYRKAAKKYGQIHHVDLPGALYFLKDYDKRIKKYLNSRKKVLEIGAGTGFATQILKKYSQPLISDTSLEMLAINKQKNLIEEAFCCSAENLPFKNEYFDLITGNNVFYLIPDKKRGARELARVLKKNGRLVFSEMNPFFLLWPAMFTSTGRFFESSVYQIFPFQIRSLFEKQGMKLEKVEFYSYTPYFAKDFLLKYCNNIQRRVEKKEQIKKFFAIRVMYILKKV